MWGFNYKCDWLMIWFSFDAWCFDLTSENFFLLPMVRVFLQVCEKTDIVFFGFLIHFNGCPIELLNGCFNLNMSDYSSMATLQNNSQPAGFAAALQRARLVSGTIIWIIVLWHFTIVFISFFSIYLLYFGIKVWGIVWATRFPNISMVHLSTQFNNLLLVFAYAT